MQNLKVCFASSPHDPQSKSYIEGYSKNCTIKLFLLSYPDNRKITIENYLSEKKPREKYAWKMPH